MAVTLSERIVHESGVVTVFDCRCAASPGGCGSEEASAAHEIVLPRSGVFLKHVGRDEVVADANHALFFNRLEPYRIRHPVAGGDRCTVLRLEPRTLLELASAGDPGAADRPDSPFDAPGCPLPARLAIAHRVMVRIAESHPPGCRLELDERALDLASGVLDAHRRWQRTPRPRHRAATLRAHRDWARDVKVLLASRYREPLSLAAVAGAVHCSPFHLSRLFRSQTGTPIHRYLTRLRLRAALEPLADEGRDLTALALDVGFSSHSHFTDSFRREFDLAPNEFRRRAGVRAVRELSKKLEARD